eukprot:1332807-Lingulodinium_polyedra.AAC.1
MHWQALARPQGRHHDLRLDEQGLELQGLRHPLLACPRRHADPVAAVCQPSGSTTVPVAIHQRRAEVAHGKLGEGPAEGPTVLRGGPDQGNPSPGQSTGNEDLVP